MHIKNMILFELQIKQRKNIQKVADMKIKS